MGNNTAIRTAALFMMGLLVAASGCGEKDNKTDMPAEVEATPAEAPGKVPTPPGPVEGSEIERYKKWSTLDWGNFPTLKSDNSTDAPASTPMADVKAVLATLEPGDAARGKEIAMDKKAGNCISCHVMPEAALAGNVGPSLMNYKAMGRDEEWVFAQIFDSRVHNDASVMPPFGAGGALTVEPKGKGGPNFQGIRDMAAYLLTLEGNDGAPTDLDDPEQRPAPVEDRDYLDPTVNPAMFAIDTAEELFASKGQTGKACAECHENPAESLKGVGAKWPKWNAEAGKIMGIEEFVEVHARKETGHEWAAQSEENLSMAIYIRYLSNGMPIEPDTTSPEAAEAMTRAEALTKRKIGQLNMACVDCHETSANKWIRGQYLGPFKGQITHFPVWRTSKSKIWDIRKRFQWCNLSVRANPLEVSSPEYGDLELFLSAQSAGMNVEVPGIRH